MLFNSEDVQIDFSFYVSYFLCQIRKLCPPLGPPNFLLYFNKSVIALHFTFKFMICFELVSYKVEGLGPGSFYLFYFLFGL